MQIGTKEDITKLQTDLKGLTYGSQIEEKPYPLTGEETFMELFEKEVESFYSLTPSQASDGELQSVINTLKLSVSVSDIREG